MVDISKRLAQAISKSGLSYAELQKKTNIAKSSIQRYATGATKKIPITAVKSLADATNFSVAWIMGWEEDFTKEKKNSIITNIVFRLHSDDKFFTAVEKFTHLSDEQLSSVQSMLLDVK